MAKVTTRDELKEHALRALGAPVIEINVDDDQLDDRVDDALQYYQTYHSDAIVRVYNKHTLTQDDIDNGYLAIPNNVTSVINILEGGSRTLNVEFNVEYHMRLQDLMTWGSTGNLQLYDARKSHLALIDHRLNSKELLRYSRHMNRLYIDDGLSTAAVDDIIVIEAWQIVDPATYTEVYNDMFLKRYVTALTKRQWGQNMSKFEGMMLPGGVTMNGLEIFNQANEDIIKLEEEMQLAWELPVDFLMG
jgi:hypothetical protein